MEIIENKARENEYINLQDYYPPKDIVLFDIETTGFAAEATKLYLIGCTYYKDNAWYIRQWFNDDDNSEKDILTDFMEFISSYKFIMHYNGDGFDIPYIQKKLTIHNIDYGFEHIESLDLYKQIKPFKDIFHIDNLKQKSVESYLSINRLDKYTGGDLIKVYYEFLQTKSGAKKQLLLQHNYEDLEGLLYSASLLGLSRFKAGCFSVIKMSVRQERLLFSLRLDYTLPKRITLGNNNIIITGFKKDATINVPIVTDTLKFFFEDYKEYYYLPAEDMAVHKSVATYVDKNYREQAKKSNCYIKRSGHFITQLDGCIIAGYKKSYEDKDSYIELVDSFLQNMELLNAYARYIISKMI